MAKRKKRRKGAVIGTPGWGTSGSEPPRMGWGRRTQSWAPPRHPQSKDRRHFPQQNTPQRASPRERSSVGRTSRVPQAQPLSRLLTTPLAVSASPWGHPHQSPPHALGRKPPFPLILLHDKSRTEQTQDSPRPKPRTLNLLPTLEIKHHKKTWY